MRPNGELPPIRVAEIKRNRADAALIAAAPELFRELDAISAALEAGETVTIEAGSIKAARIHAAIAKAKGRAK
jgi:hypothetical protein